MKIHIALVGGQPLPIYRGIVDRKSQNILFVHTQKSKNDALNLQHIFQESHQVELLECHALDFSQIRDCALNIAEKYSNYEVEINMTGGSKPMNYVFYELFKNKENAHLFFIDQNNIVTDMKSYKTHESNMQFSINELCMINGSGIKSYIDYKNYTTEDFASIKRLEKLRKHNPKIYTSMTNDIDAKTSYDDEIGNELLYDKSTDSYTLTIINNHRKLSNSIKSPHAFSLISNAGWWEAKVAKILNNWPKAEDIWVNNRFTVASGQDKNEIDVIVKTKDKLLFVEAKTQIFSPTDLDKFSTASKNYGGLAVKKLFVNYEKLNSKKKELIEAKCSENNILLFSYKEALDIELKTKKSVERQLFELIDKDYKSSNSK